MSHSSGDYLTLSRNMISLFARCLKAERELADNEHVTQLLRMENRRLVAAIQNMRGASSADRERAAILALDPHGMEI